MIWPIYDYQISYLSSPVGLLFQVLDSGYQKLYNYIEMVCIKSLFYIKRY